MSWESWPDYGKSEKQIQAEIYRMLSSLNADLGVFRNNVGSWGDGTSYVQYGLARGSPDLICILRGSIFVGIECKSLSGRETKDQKNWREMFCARLGVYHILAQGTQDKSAAMIVLERIKSILKEGDDFH